MGPSVGRLSQSRGAPLQGALVEVRALAGTRNRSRVCLRSGGGWLQAALRRVAPAGGGGEAPVERGTSVLDGGRGARGVPRGAKEKGGVVIAPGGARGTLSEIALARNVDRPGILLDTWDIDPPEGGQLAGVRRARPPAKVVEPALTGL